MQVTFTVGHKFPRVSGAASDEFAAELLRLEDSDFEEIILDFDGTEYINSMAMGSIFATYQHLREQGRSLRLVNVNESIQRLFRVANLNDLLLSEPSEG